MRLLRMALSLAATASSVSGTLAQAPATIVAAATTLIAAAAAAARHVAKKVSRSVIMSSFICDYCTQNDDLPRALGHYHTKHCHAHAAVVNTFS